MSVDFFQHVIELLIISNLKYLMDHAMQSLPFLSGETHPKGKDFRQMIHPSE